jgi:predicted 3-demethylubiquinone-9 3-methyltransferase (glyoxalase superfamily)
MQRIATCLMYVGEQYGKAEEAMNLYVSLFDDGDIVEVDRFGPEDDESGLRRAVFCLAGREFVAMDSGHPHQFGFTPAVSLFVDCETEDELERLYTGLGADGTILMPLQAYPFSPKFTWLNDRYGVSWQLRLSPGHRATPSPPTGSRSGSATVRSRSRAASSAWRTTS